MVLLKVCCLRSLLQVTRNRRLALATGPVREEEVVVAPREMSFFRNLQGLEDHLTSEEAQVGGGLSPPSKLMLVS